MVASREMTQSYPDYAFPPGDTVHELLDERGMTVAAAAHAAGLEEPVMHGILTGTHSIDEGIARGLQAAFAVPAKYWLNLEHLYLNHLRRHEVERSPEAYRAGLARFPYAEMARAGWVRKLTRWQEKAVELLEFFDIRTLGEWDVLWPERCPAYRKSKAHAPQPEAVSAWLWQGNKEARRLQAPAYDEAAFRGLLPRLRALTTESAIEVALERLEALCLQVGVRVVGIRQIRGCPVYGATWWMSAAEPVIQLSFRGLNESDLWFTFFHEVGHAILHRNQDFVEMDDGEKDAREREADAYACDLLIPPADYERITRSMRFSADQVVAFARSIGIAPGIVVGRLQHDGLLPYTHLNALKQRYVWKAE